ncbi:FkbM family methyltransferase [Candidatus Viadribacter manganicus]|uniref:Methyltransferase FkbM domain-containing protein n=1 Tax=Candidatus Viadribacter manganicus TaxID=1759059 RepID=A0A1B1AJT1_9PROT|nr:FkbM family methyltransferase [Candidatus Viadribacter manganicus]ANP46829.1 hypothetical protein ATE48_13355 [Candidatus Viadribacter manganicus]
MTSNAFDPFALIRTMLSSRAFALADTPPDAELRALLQLGETAAAADPNLAIALSAITTPRVRALFQSTTSFRTTSGLRFTVDGGDIFAATVAAGYMPEGPDFEGFMQLVGPGSVIVDVGANFGLYALSAALYARLQGRVFAFEPAPGAFALLERNIADNALGSIVTAKQLAVAASVGRAEFYIGDDVSFSSLHRTTRLDADVTSVDVEIVTLDVALSHIASIDLLKIDVEGGEGEVLSGARELLRRSRAPIVQLEYSHKNLDDARRAAFAETMAVLASDGFRIYRRGITGAVTLPAASEPFSGNLFLAREGEGQIRLQRMLERTARHDVTPRDKGALALLQVIVAQNQALHDAEMLQRELAQVADSIVGESDTATDDPVRAMQQAWLETRKRALNAENQVSSLSAAVEGRDRLVDQNSEKIASLRNIEAKLRVRLEALELALKTANGKISASRAEFEQLRSRFKDSEQKRGAANDRSAEIRAEHDRLRARFKESEQKREQLIKVSQRLQRRCEELLRRLGENVDGTTTGETTSS